MREQGIGSTDHVGAVVLETDGNLSVIKKENITENPSTLKQINGWPNSP